jgi:hypothetical protein
MPRLNAPGAGLLRLSLREPLVHFLVLGALIFMAYAIAHPAATSDERTIVVDRERLLTFLQYRAKSFDAPRFAALLDTMSPQALDDLVADYVQEEALYREAKALKLDEGDYNARRRLVQQLEFATEGFVADAKPPSNAEVDRYFAAHRSDYAAEPAITFTHIFFDRDRRGGATEAIARAELSRLNAKKVPFTEAPGRGDRPLYEVNYVQRDFSAVSNDLGAPLARTLFSLTPSTERWQGPFEGEHGVELVMVTQITKGGAPPLAEIRERVRADAAEVDKRARVAEAIAAIVKSYRVKTTTLQQKRTDAAR